MFIQHLDHVNLGCIWPYKDIGQVAEDCLDLIHRPHPLHLYPNLHLCTLDMKILKRITRTPETRNLKPETRNQKLETRNQKLETRNFKLETAERSDAYSRTSVEPVVAGWPVFTCTA